MCSTSIQMQVTYFLIWLAVCSSWRLDPLMRAGLLITDHDVPEQVQTQLSLRCLSAQSACRDWLLKHKAVACTMSLPIWTGPDMSKSGDTQSVSAAGEVRGGCCRTLSMWRMRLARCCSCLNGSIAEDKHLPLSYS
ncbi:hypothetical protein COO60DRAFT_1507742 [Scenedesmus sp. NREL 46B-D3]|nr:hypothetical protein COO60DRAFT_1507742 [Scenedesmus sp. NREL 46B-D3]